MNRRGFLASLFGVTVVSTQIPKLLKEGNEKRWSCPDGIRVRNVDFSVGYKQSLYVAGKLNGKGIQWVRDPHPFRIRLK